MPISHYPNGFSGGVSIRGVPIVTTNPGSVYWVDSNGGSNGHKGSVDQPFGTIDYAIGRCTASKGDIIFVKPGHTETISAAAGIACDVIGVAIVGLGRGSLRPTITLDTATTATLTISAANVSLHNLLFKANFADIVRIINVTAVDAQIDSCEFLATATNMNWVDVIDASGADNTADGLSVTNCRAFDLDASNDSFIEITGDINRLTVEDNVVVHDHANATAFIECATGKDIVNGVVARNYYSSLKTTGTLLVGNDTTANTGFIAGNFVSHADTAAEVLVDASGNGMGLFNNYASGVVTASGYILPAIDA